MTPPPQEPQQKDSNDMTIAAVVVIVVAVILFSQFSVQSPEKTEQPPQSPQVEPITLFRDRATTLKIWDDGVEDGDVVAVQGVVINLKNEPVSLVVPPATQGIDVQIISEGRYPPCTAAVESEAGGVTHIGGKAGGHYIIPVTWVGG